MMMEYQEPGKEITFIQFDENRKQTLIKHIPYPLGIPRSYCSICNSDDTVKVLYIDPNVWQCSIAHCSDYNCTKSAYISIAYAYAYESHLLLEKPIDINILDEYDDITRGYLKYIYTDENILGQKEIYGHIEWETYRYRTTKNISLSNIIKLSGNNYNFAEIFAHSFTRYGFFPLDKYIEYNNLFSEISKCNIIEKMEKLSFN